MGSKDRCSHVHFDSLHSETDWVPVAATSVLVHSPQRTDGVHSQQEAEIPRLPQGAKQPLRELNTGMIQKTIVLQETVAEETRGQSIHIFS